MTKVTKKFKTISSTEKKFSIKSRQKLKTIESNKKEPPKKIKKTFPLYQLLMECIKNWWSLLSAENG